MFQTGNARLHAQLALRLGAGAGARTAPCGARSASRRCPRGAGGRAAATLGGWQLAVSKLLEAPGGRRRPGDVPDQPRGAEAPRDRRLVQPDPAGAVPGQDVLARRPSSATAGRRSPTRCRARRRSPATSTTESASASGTPCTTVLSGQAQRRAALKRWRSELARDRGAAGALSSATAPAAIRAALARRPRRALAVPGADAAGAGGWWRAGRWRGRSGFSFTDAQLGDLGGCALRRLRATISATTAARWYGLLADPAWWQRGVEHAALRGRLGRARDGARAGRRAGAERRVPGAAAWCARRAGARGRSRPIVSAKMWGWMLHDQFGIVNDAAAAARADRRAGRLDRRCRLGDVGGDHGRRLEDDAVRGPAGARRAADAAAATSTRPRASTASIRCACSSASRCR